MDHLPVEIWEAVFSYACIDDGFTGRSLSVVCKYISDVSRAVRFQSLTITGIDQLRAFAKILENHDKGHSRRVRYLFIRDTPELQAIRSDPLRNSDSNGTLPEIGDASPFRQRGVSNDERDTLLFRILSIVAPTLEILAMTLQNGREYLLTPASLPVLRELSVYGTYNPDADKTTDTLEPFPALTRLHIDGSCDFRAFGANRDRAADHIRRLTPSLTHLRATSGTIIRDWGRALGLSSNLSTTKIEPVLPLTVKHIMLGPSPLLGRNEETRMMKWLAKRAPRGREITFRSGMKAINQEEVSKDWLSSIAGGEGCWTYAQQRSRRFGAPSWFDRLHLVT